MVETEFLWFFLFDSVFLFGLEFTHFFNLLLDDIFFTLDDEILQFISLLVVGQKCFFRIDLQHPSAPTTPLVFFDEFCGFDLCIFIAYTMQIVAAR